MEKVKTFMGKYILRVGSPVVIVTGYEKGNELHCETAVILETNGTPKTSASGFKIRKSEWKAAKKALSSPVSDEELLNQFIDEWGVPQAEAELERIIIDYAESKNLSLNQVYSLDLSLHETKYLNTVLYLKRKLPNQYKWLQGITKSQTLQELMKLADSIVVTEYKP